MTRALRYLARQAFPDDCGRQRGGVAGEPSGGTPLCAGARPRPDCCGCPSL